VQIGGWLDGSQKTQRRFETASFFRDSDLSFSKNPFRELARMQRQMDSWVTPSFTPGYDVEETDAHYLMSFDLPGVKKEDIKIELLDGQLTVSGERKENREERNKGSAMTERFYGSFQRSFTLPAGVKPDQIETDYKDGVLRLAIPKIETAKAHQIKVEEGKAGFWDRLLGHKKEDHKSGLQSSAQNSGKSSEKVA